MSNEGLDDAIRASGADGGKPLPELDAFLAQIGYGHFYGGVEAEPIVEDPPMNRARIACEVKAAPASREGRGWLWSLAMTVVVVALLWTPFRHAYASCHEAWAMATQPFLYQFDSLRPGTKVAEVRERLGLPAARRAIVGPLGQEEWIYTTHSARDASEDLLCILMVRSGRVMWKSKAPGPLY
ncbi:MAG: hypothetical protein RBU21_06350 [FCB group bacterium]|nr:hypothetical protein [FCB group bacterium]